jgi:hypothetical protein
MVRKHLLQLPQRGSGQIADKLFYMVWCVVRMGLLNLGANAIVHEELSLRDFDLLSFPHI